MAVTTPAPLGLRRSCACGGGCPDCLPAAAALGVEIGPADDAYEQEADTIAGQVLGLDGGEPAAVATAAGSAPSPAPMPAAATPAFSETADQDPAAEIQDEPLEPGVPGPVAAAEPPPSTSWLTRGGRPLPDALRGFYEQRFERALGQVRVHTGPAAEGLCEQLDAFAFSYANHVWFGAGLGPSRDRVTAHELTHVLQQTAAPPAPPALRRAKKPFWVPREFVKRGPGDSPGTRTHKLLQEDLRRENRARGLVTEVRVPNVAPSQGVMRPTLNEKGFADLYAADEGTVPGLFFKKAGTPALLPMGSDLRAELEQAEYVEAPVVKEVDVAGYEGPKIEEAELGPQTVRFGEIKPADAGMVSKGRRQRKAYEDGFTFAAEETNRFIDTNLGLYWDEFSVEPETGDEQMPSWPEPRFLALDDLSIPDERDFAGGGDRRDQKDLVLADAGGGAGERGSDDYRYPLRFDPKSLDDSGMLDGGLYLANIGGGLYAYFYRPAADEFRRRFKRSNLTEEYAGVIGLAARLRSEVVGPLKQGPVRGATLPRPPRPSSDRWPVIRRDGKGKKKRHRGGKLEDRFSRRLWDRSRKALAKEIERPGPKRKDEVTEIQFLDLIYDAEDAAEDLGLPPTPKSVLPKKSEYELTLKPEQVDAKDKTGTGRKPATQPRPFTFNLADLSDSILLWGDEKAKVVGLFRERFGGTFVAVSKKVDTLKLRLQQRLAERDRRVKAGGASMGKIAMKAVWRVATSLAQPVLEESVELLREALVSGLRERLEPLLPLQPDALRQALDQGFPELKALEKELADLEAGIDERIGGVTGWFDAQLAVVEEWEPLVVKLGWVIEAANVIAQCGSPPGPGCAKLLARQLAVEVIDEILDSCIVRTKIGEFIAEHGGDWLRGLPVEIATEVADRTEGLLGDLAPVFDRSVFEHVEKIDVGDACDRALTEGELAEIYLAENLSEDERHALMQLIEAYGVTTEDAPTLADAEALVDAYRASGLTWGEVAEFVRQNPTPGYGGGVQGIADLFDKIKPKLGEGYGDEVVAELGRGEHAAVLAELSPGKVFLLFQLGWTEIERFKGVVVPAVAKGWDTLPDSAGTVTVTALGRVECDEAAASASIRLRLVYDTFRAADGAVLYSGPSDPVEEDTALTGTFVDHFCSSKAD